MHTSTLSVTIAAICTLVALGLDLQQWWRGAPAESVSESWRFARTVVAVAPAFWIPFRRPGVDGRLLASAMALVVVADTFLILRHDLLTGLAVFAVMQVALIVRHLRGGELRRYLDPPLNRAVLTGVMGVVAGNLLLWAPLAERGLAVPVLAYSMLLMVAVVTAYGTSRLAFWGMVLFALCDITVGIGAAYGETPAGQLIRASTGIFYTPALILLVRSGSQVRQP